MYKTGVSGKRDIFDLSLLNSDSKTQDSNPEVVNTSWEDAYNATMEKKYHKNGRNFNIELPVKKWIGLSNAENQNNAPIYVVPRQRGGPSYKDIELGGVTSDEVFYALISKGFPMQEVSSFSMGPIVGEGLCLVNAAFSKIICISHIEGGGKVNLSRKSFWQKAKKPPRQIEVIDKTTMKVGGIIHVINTWLADNENLWLTEWDLWRKCVAMCSRGDFHWSGDSQTISYRWKERYLTFSEWKKECYIRPSYALLGNTKAYQVLHSLHQRNIPLGLVHPNGTKLTPEENITPERIRQMYDSETEMCGQPYVVAGGLLGVTVDNF